MTKVHFAVAAILLSALSLTGCSEARRALGYDKSPPDEFRVVARAPLAQPPDFTLRPPMPGAPRPQEGTVRDQAKSLLVGGRSGAGFSSGQGRSQGEMVILTKAGVDKADTDIRRKVNEESSALIDADEGFTDKVLFWRDKPVPGEAIDAADEAKRLKQNAASGKSANAGASPEIVHHSTGWMEDIF